MVNSGLDDRFVRVIHDSNLLDCTLFSAVLNLLRWLAPTDLWHVSVFVLAGCKLFGLVGRGA